MANSIILDKNGLMHSIMATRLKTLPNQCHSEFWVELSELTGHTVELRWRDDPLHYGRVVINRKACSIGCRIFSAKDFATIMRAAKKARAKESNRG